MPIKFKLSMKDETGQATIPYALMELNYTEVGGTGEVFKQQVTTGIHGEAEIVLETEGKSIKWRIAGQDPKYFCAAETIEAGESDDGDTVDLTMHTDAFITVMNANDQDAILYHFERAIKAAKKYHLQDGDVLLLRNHVVNHHEYDTNHIYGGLIGRRVTSSYQRIGTGRSDKYDNLYTPYVLYRAEEAKEQYVLEESKKLASSLKKNKRMLDDEKQRRILERTQRAKDEMADLSRLVAPNLIEMIKSVEKAFQQGIGEVAELKKKVIDAIHHNKMNALRKLLQDAQESGAKSPFISTTREDKVDLQEAITEVCKYAVDRYKDGIDLELMLISGPENAGLDFEAWFIKMDPDNEYLEYNHRSVEEREKDAELKEFGIFGTGLPLDGTSDQDSFHILKRIVLVA